MTDLTTPEIRAFHALVKPAPFRLLMPYTPGPIKDVAGLYDWLGGYFRTVEREVAKLRDIDQARARAVTVLSGLRRDVENTLSTLEELDAAIEAGTLPAGPVLHD